MVSGDPRTIGSFGELPDEANACKWTIEFNTTLAVIPGLEDVNFFEVGTDDDDRPIYFGALENETNDIDYEESEYDRIMDCLRKVKDHVTIEKKLFFTWYEQPESSDC